MNIKVTNNNRSFKTINKLKQFISKFTSNSKKFASKEQFKKNKDNDFIQYLLKIH